ncbi:Hsp20/alpha crystallin family protein [Magnetospirillum sp. UT-4]|uniref:Hsp20/alpha crystallin family protein n=1 Tax=Magnetospirillum sp. UT-4 TaxID=2681467 RepID=UPI00137F3A4C|nr:Hsp20/alpha crystallin family protein [Magnetospirillum sp. UT-4]CAA7612770.1 putative Heat shock protein Hsp20 [Magnetospirillum sp. UT-4]
MAERMPRHSPDPGSAPASRTHHPLMALRDEVDRLFDSFFPAAFGRTLLGLDPWRAPSLRALGGVYPSIDVKETADRYEIAAELPGLEEKDVNVTIRNGVLSIAGEKRHEHEEEAEGLQVRERTFGSFARTFRLPENANPDGIAAEFAKGVLTVTVPKAEDAAGKERKVEVKGH